MEVRFTMTPEAKEFLYGPSEKPEYVVCGPVNIEVELMSGEINRPQEIRERITRCRDCVHAITSYRDGLPRCVGPLVMEATLVSPDGFCAWGEPREVGE